MKRIIIITAIILSCVSVYRIKKSMDRLDRIEFKIESLVKEAEKQANIELNQ